MPDELSKGEIKALLESVESEEKMTMIFKRYGLEYETFVNEEAYKDIPLEKILPILGEADNLFLCEAIFNVWIENEDVCRSIGEIEKGIADAMINNLHDSGLDLTNFPERTTLKQIISSICVCEEEVPECYKDDISSWLKETLLEIEDANSILDIFSDFDPIKIPNRKSFTGEVFVLCQESFYLDIQKLTRERLVELVRN